VGQRTEAYIGKMGGAQAYQFQPYFSGKPAFVFRNDKKVKVVTLP
jgi:hypothetical protein